MPYTCGMKGTPDQIERRINELKTRIKRLRAERWAAILRERERAARRREEGEGGGREER